MLSKMDNLLLHLSPFTVGAYGLVIGSVSLIVPLDVDLSYVDGRSFVVFIIDTTSSLAPSCGGCQLLGQEGFQSRHHSVGDVIVQPAKSNDYISTQNTGLLAEAYTKRKFAIQLLLCLRAARVGCVSRDNCAILNRVSVNNETAE